MRRSFVPVLLGLDLNAYSVALSFFETYGLKSHAFGRYKCGITEHSRFVRTHVVKDMDKEECGVAALLSFAEKHREEELFLVPCSDWYLSFLEKTREILREKYTFFIPPKDIFFMVSDKKSFYESLDRHEIAYPKTEVIGSVFEVEKVLTASDIPFPAVLKPSDSTAYYSHPFPGMKKVYFPKNREEAEKIATGIFAAGYDKTLLLQKYVDARSMATFTVMIGKDGRVRRGVLGHILLEERAPTARGNYAAIVTAPMDEISHRLLAYCQEIGYEGIGNFDILYGKDGKVYVLEMNPRQGRSSDYLRGCGVSVAEFLRTEAAGDNYPKKLTYPGIYWRCVNDRTVREHAENAQLLSLAEEYAKNGFAFSPFHGNADVRFRPVRAIYVMIHEKRRGKAFTKERMAKDAL